MSDARLAAHLPYKSAFLAILLGLAGPFGLIYTTWVGGLIMLILMMLLSMIPKVGGMFVMLIWLICLFWNVANVERINKRLLARYTRAE